MCVNHLSNVGRYLYNVELQAFQINADLKLVLKIFFTYQPFSVMPGAGLHYILAISQKYITRDYDSLMFIPMSNLHDCNTHIPTLQIHTKQRLTI